MIPDLQASFPCEDVRVEATGSHTIVGIINGITAPNFPVRLMKFCIWTRWCSGSGNFKQTTRLLNPEEKPIAFVETPFMLDDEESHVVNVNVFAGVEFFAPGTYHIEILLDGELTLRYPLRVFLAENILTSSQS